MNIEHIWKEYRVALKAFVHSKVSDENDVDDLLQDILIKTYQNLPSVKSEKSIKSWLFQIANRVVIDFYRKKGRIVEIDTDDLWFSDENSNKQQALSQCIEPFINALPDKTAKLLMAVDILGQSQKDYANQHDISYSTLKSRVQKARSQLRLLFEDCCHLSLDKHGNVIDFEQKSNHCKNC